MTNKSGEISCSLAEFNLQKVVRYVVEDYNKISKSTSKNAKNTRPKAQAYREKDLESNNKTLQTMK